MNKRKLSLIFTVSLMAMSLVNASQDVSSIGYAAKAKSLLNGCAGKFNNYANKETLKKGATSLKNGAASVLQGVKDNKAAIAITTAFVVGAGIQKAVHTYNAKPELLNPDSTIAALNEVVAGLPKDIKLKRNPSVDASVNTDAPAPVKETPVVAPVKETPVVAPVKKEASVVAPVKKEAPKKAVRPTVAEIAKASGANVQSIISALKAHGYKKNELKASDFEGILNDGQFKFVLSKV